MNESRGWRMSLTQITALQTFAAMEDPDGAERYIRAEGLYADRDDPFPAVVRELCDRACSATLSETVSPKHEEVCGVCGGRAAACRVLGHRPESDRHIQWQKNGDKSLRTDSMAAYVESDGAGTISAIESKNIICGSNSAGLSTEKTGGCGEPIRGDVYRCADCGVPFHRAHIKKHFGECPDTPSARGDNMDERDFRALEQLLVGRIGCSDDLPEDERPRSLNARLLFGHIHRLRTAAAAVIASRTEDFGGLEAERHARALDDLAKVLVAEYVSSSGSKP